MKQLIITISLFLLLITGCKHEPIDNRGVLDIELQQTLEIAADNKGISFFQQPESTDFANIPQDPQNPITAEKVALGKLLFHETALAVIPRRAAGLNQYSCASCHHYKAGFQAGRRQGLGEGGLGFGIAGEGRYRDLNYASAFLDVQPIKSPSTLNVAYQKNMLYDGSFGATGTNENTASFWTEFTPRNINFLGYEGVESQAIAGHATHQLDVDADFIMNSDYKSLFDNSFPDVPVDLRYNDTIGGLAIAAYERTMLANRSPFQLWLRGDWEAMSDQEKKGATLFFGKANCTSCHTGPALSSMNYYALGMGDLVGQGIFGSEPPTGPTNRGRGGFNSNEADFYKFKVPQLYNLLDSPFYGHGSTFTSVEAVVRYKNEAIAEKGSVPATQLAEGFVPLSLSEVEIADLSVFLKTGLRDPELERYVPEVLPSGLCLPNNDVVSRMDLGCQ